MRVAGGATPVPADASAVVVNVTATDVSASTGKDTQAVADFVLAHAATR